MCDSDEVEHDIPDCSVQCGGKLVPEYVWENEWFGRCGCREPMFDEWMQAIQRVHHRLSGCGVGRTLEHEMIDCFAWCAAFWTRGQGPWVVVLSRLMFVTCWIEIELVEVRV